MVMTEITDLLEFGFPIGFLGKLDWLTSTTKIIKGLLSILQRSGNTSEKKNSMVPFWGPSGRFPMNKNFVFPL